MFRLSWSFVFLYPLLFLTTLSPLALVGREGDLVQKSFESTDITAILPHIDRQTLVVFDIDNTLIRSKTQLGSMLYLHHLIEKDLAKNISLDETVNRHFPFWLNLQRDVQVVPVDKRLPSLVAKIQKQAFAVLGLTERPIQALVTTIGQLNFAGYDVTHYHPQMATLNSPSCFKENILFSGNYMHKEEALDQLLASLNQGHFNQLVYIDDYAENIQQMAFIAKKHSLHYVGMRYSQVDESAPDFNPAIAQKQLEYLHQIVDDELALKIDQMPQTKGLLKNWTDPLTSFIRQDRSLITSPILEKKTPTSPAIQPLFQLDEVLKIAVEKPLFIFNINALMKTKTTLGSEQWANSLIEDHIKRGLRLEESINRLIPLWHQILLCAKAKAVDDAPLFIHKMKEKGVAMIGLTNRYIEMAYTTLTQLNSVNISFKDNPAASMDFTVKSPYPAKFIDGTLFIGQQNAPSTVLLHFLQQNPLDFNQIIYVDDQLSRLEEMEKAAQTLKKGYRGLWVQGIKKEHVNPQIAQVQLFLLENIMPDEIAAKLVEMQM